MPTSRGTKPLRSLREVIHASRSLDRGGGGRFAQAALETDRVEGARLGLRGRLAGLGAAAILLTAVLPFPDLFWYWGMLALLALSGWAQHLFSCAGRTNWQKAFLFFDAVIFVTIVAAPNPFFAGVWPAAVVFQFGAFKYVFVFIAALALGAPPRLVVSFGVWLAILWLVATLLLDAYGHRVPGMSEAIGAAVGGDERLAKALDPNDVNWAERFEDVVVLLLVSVMLGINGFRARRSILAEADEARQRANLARHFAPTMVETLASRDEVLTEVRRSQAVVMFIDIVGFTAYARQAGAEETVRTLRAFHADIERIVFEHGGTLDKFLGDGAMISFGTPLPQSDDAVRALACVRELARIEVRAEGLRAVVGAHRGEVVLGDLGSERRLEFAIIGDTVNVAARLEESTRAQGVRAIISGDFVNAAGTDGGLRHIGPLELRGRDESVDVWAID